jgi:hypothetical protein
MNKKNFLILFFLTVLFFSIYKITNSQSLNCNFERILKIGSRGLDVLCLQIFLKNEGYFDNFLKFAGYYNLITKKAVMEWQKNNKISPANGIFDEKSINFYNEKYKKIKKEKEIQFLSLDENDIQISNEGYSNLYDYIKFYLNIDLINKDDSELMNYSKKLIEEFNNKKEIPSFFPITYIKDYLENKDNDINKLKERLNFLRKIFEIRLEKLKNTKINVSLKEIHKKFIYFDLLEIALLDKFNEFLDKKIEKNIFLTFLNKYEEIQNKNTEDIKGIIRTQLNISENNKFFNSLMSLLIGNNVFAQIVNKIFGGKILNVITCDCFGIYGYTIQIGPPRQAIIFVPISYLASPLNFLWKQITKLGVWALGLYIPVSPVCTYTICTPDGCYCPPTNIQPQGTIFMSGTSLE